MGPFDKDNALVRAKRTWLFAVTMVFAVGGFAPAIFGALHAVSGHPLFLLLVAAYHASMIGALYAWNRSWLEQRARVRGDEAGLWLGDRLVIRRDSVRHGYVLERDGRTYVRFGRMLRAVDVEVADRAEGEALLAAMRLDGARSVAQYPMTHGTWRGSLVRAAIAIVPLMLAPVVATLLGGTLPVFMACLIAVAVATCAYSFNQLVRVSVGADGLRVRRLLERSRYFPFSSIALAETDGRNISIHLHDGETVTMHNPAGGGLKPLAFADHALTAEKLVERINEQVAAHSARPEGDGPIFARAGRETTAWLRDVVTAADVNASYRTPAVPPDELWRIVEDAAAPATARAGAAVALRQGLDEPGRLRLNAVADACAAPRLRVALETVASAEDEELLRGALDELVDDEAPRRALAVPSR